MPDNRYLLPERVAAAITNLSAWKIRAHSQYSMHLWPLLSLIRGGVGKSTLTQFTWSDEKAFWDRFFRFPDGTPPEYIEPLTREAKPETYVNGGPWAIRKRTFMGSWQAVQADSAADPTSWKLAPNFAEIFARKALTKSGTLHRVPVVDLAAWLYREEEFSGTATPRDLEAAFKREFPFESADYDRIFEFAEELPSNIFAPTKATADELRDAIQAVLHRPEQPPATPAPLLGPDQSSLVPDEDSIFVQVKDLLELGTSGIIFRGCPGTGKTWYAKQIAHKLVSHPDHIFQCQFHPSFGYEDFVEGYKPDEDSVSGFRITDKVFLNACRVAEAVPGYVVFIVDEMNRGDPARVFGELLTYIEHAYRGDEFLKAYSGDKATVPKNLIIFGTMNQHDRSITQFDLALTRRFDHIDLMPDAEMVAEFLERSGNFEPEQVEQVSKWFGDLQRLLEPVGIGHTFFKDANRPDQLRLIWQHRMLPFCESILELEQTRLANVKASFEGMYRAVIGQGDG